MKLLNIDKNAKTVKGQSAGYLTGILYLAPARLSGYEVCPMATDGCRAACLNTAGRGRFSTIQNARIRKTKWFFEDHKAFMDQLAMEIKALLRKADKMGLSPAVRLNGTSDIPWEYQSVMGYSNLMEMFPEVTFYDYTKRYNRKNLPNNYSLTFSLAENNHEEAFAAAENGMNVAIVFRDKSFLKHSHMKIWGKTFNLVDGDKNDLRFLDQSNSIVALYAKGAAKKDISGFVREFDPG